MFVRARKAKGRLYYQLVRGYRDAEGKVRQETIGMGASQTVTQALEVRKWSLTRAKRERSRWKGVTNNDYAAKQFKRWDKTVAELEAVVAKLAEAKRDGIG